MSRPDVFDRHVRLAQRMLPDIIRGLLKLPPIPGSVALVTIQHDEEEWQWARVPLSDLAPWAQELLGGPRDDELRIWLMVCARGRKITKSLRTLAVRAPLGAEPQRYTLH